MRPLSFRPTPDSPAWPITIYNTRFFGWSALCEELAAALGCDEGALWLEDVYWGDDSAEVVTLEGEIIGAINRDLTAADVAAINGETETERRVA